MRRGARSHRRADRRAARYGTAVLITLLAATEGHAQFGPVRHNGYLEYQYRNTRNEGLPSNSLHLATWRTNLSTFLVQPWILQLDGSLALTETRSARGDTP